MTVGARTGTLGAPHGPKGARTTTIHPLTGIIDADLTRITAPVSPPPVIASSFIGEIRTVNEYPTAETIDKLFDQLDFQRACQAFLRNITASSMYSFREGLRRDLGATTAQHYVTWDGPFDANSLLPDAELGDRLRGWRWTRTAIT